MLRPSTVVDRIAGLFRSVGSGVPRRTPTILYKKYCGASLHLFVLWGSFEPTPVIQDHSNSSTGDNSGSFVNVGVDHRLNGRRHLFTS
jgi:hypothetical protein